MSGRRAETIEWANRLQITTVVRWLPDANLILTYRVSASDLEGDCPDALVECCDSLTWRRDHHITARNVASNISTSGFSLETLPTNIKKGSCRVVGHVFRLILIQSPAYTSPWSSSDYPHLSILPQNFTLNIEYVLDDLEITSKLQKLFVKSPET